MNKNDEWYDEDTFTWHPRTELQVSKNKSMNESEIPVKEGGTKITDFEDLRIAFLDLNEKHNKLAKDYDSLKTDFRWFKNNHYH